MSQQSQSSQKYFISKDCDYDRSPLKMIVTLFLRIAIMIVVLINALFMRTAFMIAVLIKKSCFWLFIWLRPWFQSSLLGLRSWSQYSLNVLYLSLYEDCNRDHCPKTGLRPSQNVKKLFLRFCEDCDYDCSLHKMPYFSFSSDRTHREHEQNKIYKKVNS